MAKIKMGRWEYTEQELANMFDEATIHGKLASSVEPQAESVYYDRATNRVVVDLKNGATFIFPSQLAEGLRDGAADDIAQVELGPRGASLHWDKLNVDFSLVGLMSGVFGSKLWMAKLGRNGGGAKTKPDVSRLGGKGVGGSNRDLKRTPSRRKIAKQRHPGRAQGRP